MSTFQKQASKHTIEDAIVLKKGRQFSQQFVKEQNICQIYQQQSR